MSLHNATNTVDDVQCYNKDGSPQQVGGFLGCIKPVLGLAPRLDYSA